MTARRRVAYRGSVEDALRKIKHKSWRTYDQVKAAIDVQARETRPRNEIIVGPYHLKLTVEGDKLIVTDVLIEVRRYTVTYLPKARDQITKIRKGDRRAADSIEAAIKKLADNPRPSGVRKLAGHERSYRIAVDLYRVIYDIDDDQLIVTVIETTHRQGSYRGW